MDQPFFQEIRLRNFRCFQEQQTVRAAPLTLLVGENSTGKTSFLAAARAVWEAGYGEGDPDFHQAPYDLGSFREIVHGPGRRRDEAGSFTLGFRGLGPAKPGGRADFLDILSPPSFTTVLDFDATFTPRAGAPYPAITAWRDGQTSVTYRQPDTEGARVELESPNGSWSYRIPEPYQRIPEHLARNLFPRRERFDPFWPFGVSEGNASSEDEPFGLVPDWEASAKGSTNPPGQQDRAEFSYLLDQFPRRPTLEPPFAGAPIRSSPRRTYDPTRPVQDPEGGYVPTYLAHVNLRDTDRWSVLKTRLEEFGRRSGLFDEVSVNQLNRAQGGPFQLEIHKFSRRRKGAKRNLIDVGYGVSQALPVLVELLRADGLPMFLLQQPEVHLHPSAQAALGSLFCATAAFGRQLFVETHSEYILDRIRMDVRDRRADLTPEDVSVLFFERLDLDVRIHSLRFDDLGNVLEAPDGYGRFFLDETRRSVGL